MPALAFDALVRRLAPALPLSVVQRWARLAIGDRQAALCLHRVGADRRDASALVLPAPVLDEVVAAAERIGRGKRWLALSFDDGYLDAVRYVAARAERHPSVEWHVFICPDKAARRRGFRWDAGLDSFAELPADVAALGREHERSALLRTGEQPGAALADIELLRQVRDAGFAEVGNHTDHHLPLAWLDSEVAACELAGSLASFERHLGTCRSFAFPFGTPGLYWRPEHAEQLRSAGVERIWSVQSRTFTAAERVPGAVLPRFPVDGRDDARTILALVAARATLERALCVAATVRRRGTDAAGAGAAARSRAAMAIGAAPCYVWGEPMVHLAGPAAADSEATPTVFVYGASGHVETFRALAPVLGESRPVYAVRAMGLLEGERPAADVGEALEVAVDSVKQLGRAVDLVGYSLGGLLALGMAGPLEQAGLLAGPVRLVDTYAGSLEVLPLGTRVRNAAAFARHHGVVRVLPWTRRLVERQVRAALRRPAPRPAWLEDLGFGEGRVAGLEDLELHHRALLDDLGRLSPYCGDVRLVRSLDLAPNLPADAGLGDLLQGRIDVRFVQGDHFSMLSPQRVQRLLSALFN